MKNNKIWRLKQDMFKVNAHWSEVLSFTLFRPEASDWYKPMIYNITKMPKERLQYLPYFS